MAENFGGPVWHASGGSSGQYRSRRVALDGLAGVGDSSLGEWGYPSEKRGVVHVIRRLSHVEREMFTVPEPYDIRGTDEERERIAAVYSEAPYLRGLLP